MTGRKATIGEPGSDLDLAYALSLGLVFWVGDKIKQTYLGFGMDLGEFQGNGGWLLPIPATVVVGRDGRVKARLVDPDFRHRMAIEKIVGAVVGETARWRLAGRAGRLAVQQARSACRY